MCTICPINCNIDRTATKQTFPEYRSPNTEDSSTHFCHAPDALKINTAMLHFGEEPVLCGNAGSGTIFFSHCNLRCVYCQNYKISAQGAGEEISDERFIEIAHDLQRRGAQNINLVSPTPYTHRLIPLLEKLKKSGLTIPIVWNSNAYEKSETIKKLEGLVDIYLPDFKYWDDEVAFKYSHINNYRATAQAAIKEMHKQTGNLRIDEDGIAYWGTLIRLLVLPNDISKTKNILNWLSQNLGNETHISLMSQYYPAYKANTFSELNRGITNNEYDEIVNYMQSLGFENGFIQTPATTPQWTPEFR